MKSSIWIAAGVAIVATAVYFWRRQQSTSPNTIPEKENERHHLTNIFSKAKRMAIGN
jgi:hypothetical protein